MTETRININDIHGHKKSKGSQREIDVRSSKQFRCSVLSSGLSLPAQFLLVFS